MTDLEWTRALVILGLVGQVALAVDRWVHRQTDGGVHLKERVDAHDKRFDEAETSIALMTREVDGRLTRAADRAHRHNKAFQRNISHIELCVALIAQHCKFRLPRMPANDDADDERAS